MRLCINFAHRYVLYKVNQFAFRMDTWILSISIYKTESQTILHNNISACDLSKAQHQSNVLSNIFKQRMGPESENTLNISIRCVNKLVMVFPWQNRMHACVAFELISIKKLFWYTVRDKKFRLTKKNARLFVIFHLYFCWFWKFLPLPFLTSFHLCIFELVIFIFWF